MDTHKTLQILFSKDKKYLQHNAIYCGRRWMFVAVLLFITFIFFNSYNCMLMGCFCFVTGIVHYFANLKGIRMIISIPINQKFSRKYRHYIGNINDVTKIVKDEEHNVI